MLILNNYFGFNIVVNEGVSTSDVIIEANSVLNGDLTGLKDKYVMALLKVYVHHQSKKIKDKYCDR